MHYPKNTFPLQVSNIILSCDKVDGTVYLQRKIGKQLILILSAIANKEIIIRRRYLTGVL